MSFLETRMDANISVSSSKVQKKADSEKKKKRTSKAADATETGGTEQVEMPSFPEDVLQETQLASIQSSHQAPSTPLRATPAKKAKKSQGRRSSRAKLSFFAATRSRSRRAGIIFPVGRMKSSLRRRYNRRYRVGIAAAVYLSAVLEYLVAEAVELGGYLATHDKRRRITPRHLMIAIRTDEEFNALIGKTTFAHSGVVPNIPIALLNGKKMELSKPSFALSTTLPI